MKLLLKGGHVVDPSQQLDSRADVMIDDGMIAQVGSVPIDEGVDCVVDVTGKIVAPGFIDMHVHLREPGFEYKEDIGSGSRAAAAGGFTGVACMPNTKPAIDCRSIVEFVRMRASQVGLTRVYPIGALSKGMNSDEMAEIADMIGGGAVAFSDDAFPIQSAGFMRRAMEYCSMLNVPVIVHCEDKTLSDEGLMNEGLVSAVMGLKGIPDEAEELAVMRNIMLARLSGCKLHIAHVSTRGAVEIIRKAKSAGVNITCETCPQYFTLTEDTVRGYNTNAKMNPPLRTEDDRDAIIEGLADGTIDVIATDHAPHSVEEKETDFASALNGIIGLETSVPLAFTNLVKKKRIGISDMVALMSTNPARVLGINAGTLNVGVPADITVIDTDTEVTIDPSSFQSKSKNTPFSGMRVFGMPVMTILNGKIVAEYKGTL